LAHIKYVRATFESRSFSETARYFAQVCEEPLVVNDPQLQLKCLIAKGDTDPEIDSAPAEADWRRVLALAYRLHKALPPYEEDVLTVRMDPQLESAYRSLEDDIKHAIEEYGKSQSLLSVGQLRCPGQAARSLAGDLGTGKGETLATDDRRSF
jgi:hypothetical protein